MSTYEVLTKTQRWKIADLLVRDRLPSVNQIHSPVIPADGVYVRYGKRVLDILISGSALLITVPVNLFIAIGTYISVGRPLLFKQERVGKDGKLFHIIKFRNMTNETDERGELLPAAERVTRFGKFVRRTSLDELLNFVSVIKGDMSIIGPRPLVPEYTHRYSNRHRARLAVRPGLECPPRQKLDHVWTWHEQMENDVWYVENVSLKTDISMFMNLVRFALDRKSAKARAMGDRGTFMGYDENGIAITVPEIPQEYIDMVIEQSEAHK